MGKSHVFTVNLKNMGANIVPKTPPIAGAKQSPIVNLFVTRVRPINLEKIEVNGAMKRICALRPRIKPTSNLHVDKGGQLKKIPLAQYIPAATVTWKPSSSRNCADASDTNTERSALAKFIAAISVDPQPNFLIAIGWNVPRMVAFRLNSKRPATAQKLISTLHLNRLKPTPP